MAEARSALWSTSENLGGRYFSKYSLRWERANCRKTNRSSAKCPEVTVKEVSSR